MRVGASCFRGGEELFPADRVIDDRYLEKALPMIHEQLAKAAVRLAGVWNRVWGRA